MTMSDSAAAGDCSLGRLAPSDRLELLLSESRAIAVPLARVTYRLWAGAPIADAYGGKPVVVDPSGRPTFAELAILRDLEVAGWRGVWVDSYRSRMLTAWPPVRGELDRAAGRRFDRVAQVRRGKSWDVVASCGDRLLFVEAKRRGKDKIRDSQLAWLDAALELGLSPEDFLVVEWSIE